MGERCNSCFIRFAILEEKILFKKEFFHRKCLILKLRALNPKNNKIFITDKDLKPINLKGLYNVFEYKPQK
ncbi:MAG: hypothetical protein ACPL3E_00985 [Minisyncoccia bacterium]